MDDESLLLDLARHFAQMTDLEWYLWGLPWCDLRGVQQALHARVDGDARRNANLKASIIAHVQQEGLTMAAVLDMGDHVLGWQKRRPPAQRSRSASGELQVTV